jgi:hypothetical protein
MEVARPWRYDAIDPSGGFSMDLSDPKVWTDGISVVSKAPHIAASLVIATAIAVWWFRGTVENARRDGLQSIINGRDAQLAGKDAQIAAKDAQIAVRDTQIAGVTTQGAVTHERLQLANEMQNALTIKLADATNETEKLRKQANEKATPEEIAATAKNVADLVGDTGTANTALHEVLKFNAPNLFFTPTVRRSDSATPKATLPSESPPKDP